ncbi:MAG: hypothetical protein AAFP19_21830 [Bacteroidota bacterium]
MGKNQDEGFAFGAQKHEPTPILQSSYPFYHFLVQNLESEQVQVLNPLPMLQSADREKAVYYNNDPHLNPYGQAVLGEWMLEHIRPLLVN